jgi:hypothetical protein
MNKDEKKIGAGDIADVVTRAQKECVHRVIMASPCTLCFKEFKTVRLRRQNPGIEHDWEPALRALDRDDAAILAHVDAHMTFAKREIAYESIGGTSNE